MKYSTNYKFNLPTFEDDTLADIGVISQNFETVDRVMKKNEDLGTELNRFEADTITAVGRLNTKDADLQSQINTKATRKVAVVGSDAINSDGWYKVASGTMTKYQVISLLFAVHRPDKSGKYSGILQLDLRGDAEAIVTGDELKLGWLVRTGFDLSQVIITVDGYNWALYYNLRSNLTFRTFFEVIQESSGTSNKATYNLHTDSVVETTAPVATATSVDLGTVNTANKLTTARNINGIAFDGSKDINITANDIKDRNSSQTISDTIVKLRETDTNLQSQIDAFGGVDVSELQSQLDAKVDKVDGKGLSTNDYDDRAKEKVSNIGNTNLIPSDSRYIVNWIQDVYDSVFKSSAENVCLADRVAEEISHRQLHDENLQSQIDTKVTRKVAVAGSDIESSAGWYKVASGTMTKYQVISLLFAVHTPATSGKHSGILQLDLRGGTESIDTGDALKLGWLVRTGFDSSQVIVTVDGYNWALYYKVQSPRFFRAFFEVIQESSGTNDKATYNLHTDSVVEATAPVATATSVDLGTVNTANKLTTARNINGIAFDGSKDINIAATDIASTSGPEHNLAYEIGMTRADLDAVEAKIGTWATGETISNTISSMRESIKDIEYEVSSARTDLNAVEAQIGSWGTSKTLYDMIVDLTARIEALENSAS